MRLFSSIALAIATFAADTALADVYTGKFLVNDQGYTTSGGTVEFALNQNGTIGASVTSAMGNILGFGFNAPKGYKQTNLSFPHSIQVSWVTDYGSFGDGFRCYPCSISMTWTIGSPGQFTSVQQAWSGPNHQYDFFLYDSNFTQWAFDTTAPAASPAPEPASWAMFIGGFGLVGATMRRRQRVAVRYGSPHGPAPDRMAACPLRS